MARRRFGLPAGFGANSLVKHAKFSYGVDLSRAEARRFIQLLTTEVYPELRLYLADDTVAILAEILRDRLWDRPEYLTRQRVT